MPDKAQTKVAIILVIASLSMLALVFATPFVFFEERPGLPVYPLFTIDYLDDEGVYIILINSISGDHLYRNVTIRLNGVEERINYTYSIERHCYVPSVDIDIRMFDEDLENMYEFNASIDRRDGADGPEFDVTVLADNDTVEDTVQLSDMPYSRRIMKVEP